MHKLGSAPKERLNKHQAGLGHASHQNDYESPLLFNRYAEGTLEMSQKQKSRFINLAAQLADQNESVGKTIDSLLAAVIQQHNAEDRSDWHEVKKTMDKLTELKALAAPSKPDESAQNAAVPKPKLTRQHENQSQDTPISR